MTIRRPKQDEHFVSPHDPSRSFRNEFHPKHGGDPDRGLRQLVDAQSGERVGPAEPKLARLCEQAQAEGWPDGIMADWDSALGRWTLGDQYNCQRMVKLAP